MQRYLEIQRVSMIKRMRAERLRSPDDVLLRCRRFLRSLQHHMQSEHRNGRDGLAVVGLRSLSFDVLLTHLWQTAQEELANASRPALALVALGGYGRSELNPASDIDVMFLHGESGKEKAIAPIIERVLYILWDLGLKVGHSTRRIKEAIDKGNEDFQTKTSLLESRLVTGDQALFDQFHDLFIEDCVEGKEGPYLEWRLEDQDSRHKKHGGSVFLQEPNIKESCGGLRDYHNLRWVSFMWRRLRETAALAKEEILAAQEVKQLDRAFDFLLRVRTQLHFISGRANDQLSLPIQNRVAMALGYNQRTPIRRVEAFMRDYYKAAWDIHFYTNAASRAIASRVPRGRRRLFGFLVPEKRKTVDLGGFILRDGEIHLEDKRLLTQEPLQILRLFLLLQQHQATLSYDLQRLVRRRLTLVNRPLIYHKTARELMLEILSNRGVVSRALRAMHQCGVLGRVFPEFAPLTCLVQHEFFHRYSADEHTMVCMDQLDQLVTPLPSPQMRRYADLLHKIEDTTILYLAMLLHDTGKGQDTKNHAEVGALFAMRAGKRLRLPPESIRTLTFLVDHHMTLSNMAQRRNVDDVETIYEFARIVENEDRLDLLMLLTYADGRGTTGGVGWSDWKESLIWRLCDNTRALLSHGPEFAQRAHERMVELHQSLRDMLPKSISEAEIATHLACLPKKYTQAYAEQDMARHIRAIHEFFRAQTDADTNPLSPVLQWTHHPDRGYSEVIIVTWDRAFLFEKITGALSFAGLNILSADIFTRTDSIVVDVFCVNTQRGEAVTDERDHRPFSIELEKALQGSEFDFGAGLRKLRDRQMRELAQEGGFPTVLAIDNSLPDYTLLEVQTPDRVALLHDLANALSLDGIQTAYARIETVKGAALDTFYLVQTGGGKIHEPTTLERLRERVLACTDGVLNEAMAKSTQST